MRGNIAMTRRYNPTPIEAGRIDRRGIEGIRFTDGPRGVVMGNCTAFPVPMARGATFDPALEAEVGDAIGVEARTLGANLFAGVCINLLRHPAWGRAQETYGEDTHLLGEMGAALVRGTQRHVMACVKHYACNSMENSRFWVDVRIDPADLRDLYLPHFKRCVDEGASAVMSAYNKVNGHWCGQNRELFDRDPEGGVGLRRLRDVGLPLGGARRPGRLLQCRPRPRDALPLAVQEAATGHAPVPGVRGPPRRRGHPAPAPTGAPARGAASPSATGPRRSARPSTAGWPAGWPSRGRCYSRTATPCPSTPRPSGRWPSSGSWPRCRPPVTRGRARSTRPRWSTCSTGCAPWPPPMAWPSPTTMEAPPERALALAGRCDAVIVAAGNSFEDEGEWIGRSGGDRRRLTVAPADERLIEALAGAHPRTTVVLLGGSAFVTDPWRAKVGALVAAWYPGMEGGRAVADILFGHEIPGGRLPCSWPASTTQLPPFKRFTRKIAYGPLHGYRMHEAEGTRPAYPFGYGLGYTKVEWEGPEVVGAEAGRVQARVRLHNRGSRPGVTVVQGYVAEPLGSDPRPLRTLRAFKKVRIEAGGSAEVTLDLPLPPGATGAWVGPSSDPDHLRPVPVTAA